MLTELFLKIALLGAEWVLWVLMLLSFANVAIIVERFLFFRRDKASADLLEQQLPQLLSNGDMRGAWQLVADNDAIEAQVVAAGLRAMQRGPQACAEAMLSAKSRLKGKLDARLAVLGTIGSNAPFIGLLGTVLGIIKAATDILKETGDPTAVMKGVFEALVATAVGLFVAIPAVIAYNYFQRKVKGTLAQVDSLAHLVLTTVAADRRASPPPAAAAPQPQPQPARVP
jgi:biopolymer transport protein ExbB